MDGFIARRYKLESVFGTYLDPICDKLFSISGIFLITIYFDFPVHILILVIIREILGALVGTILFFKSGFQGESHFIGKLGITITYFNILYYLSIPDYFRKLNIYILNLPAIILLIIYFCGAVIYMKIYWGEIKRGLQIARRGT